jgi:hypothetical protein
MRQESTFGKVIVRTKSGELHRGFSKAEFIGEQVRLIDAKGNQHEFRLDELKAVFFVKDFSGDTQYRAVSFFGKEPESPWLWAQVTFKDDEVLEGRVRNDLSLIDSPGFFLRLSDEGANNDTAYVVKSAVKDFRVMGI